ncbi:MAG: YtxH domain-containing protein [Chloroflexi bacterium]|nr:YtxH domain-containing protein [Ktedonobacteraceae bacterium]MBV8821907.1 YtxH domain-containing protein [Ktedonobacteraceae bacterium]MBV9022180.1 YtxH domain-containing protein [Ktedonobacteraceae bacterium]MBV9706017.1 YtxH domain-containing protein [Chloroflexota bacterium]
MKGFFPGLLLGIALGLLFAPMSGEEARRILRNMSATELVSQYAQQIIGSLSQGSTSFGDLTQFSVSRIIEENGSTFKSLAELVVNRATEDGSAFNSIGNMLDRVVGGVRG